MIEKPSRLYERRYSQWRAVARDSSNTERLLFVGQSYDQVKRNYPLVFWEYLTDEEQQTTTAVFIEKWNGVADSGQWKKEERLAPPNAILIKKKTSLKDMDLL